MNDDLFDYKSTENLFYGPGGVKSPGNGGTSGTKESPKGDAEKWLGYAAVVEGIAQAIHGIRGMPKDHPGLATQTLVRMAGERESEKSRQNLLSLLQAFGAFEQGRTGAKMSGQNPAIEPILSGLGSQVG